MCKVICIFRKESELSELSVNAKYDVISIGNGEILVLNNLSKVHWYPSHYFRFI